MSPPSAAAGERSHDRGPRRRHRRCRHRRAHRRARAAATLHPVAARGNRSRRRPHLVAQRGDLALSVGAHMFPPPDPDRRAPGDGVRARRHADQGVDAQRRHGRAPGARHPPGAVAVPPAAGAARPRVVRARGPARQAGRRRVHEADPAATRRHRRRRPPARAAARRRHDVRRVPRPAAPRRRPHLRGAREPLDRRSGRDLAVRDGGAVRARLGLRRSRPQHARRIGPAAGRARPRPRADRPHRHARHLA